MKTLSINIHPELKDVTVTVKNGKLFQECLNNGIGRTFIIDVADKDIKRVKQFAIRKGNDKSSCFGNWYAHCNGYAMDLCITNRGKYITINTWKGYNK